MSSGGIILLFANGNEKNTFVPIGLDRYYKPTSTRFQQPLKQEGSDTDGAFRDNI